jgi:hypothetical protein
MVKRTYCLLGVILIDIHNDLEWKLSDINVYILKVHDVTNNCPKKKKLLKMICFPYKDYVLSNLEFSEMTVSDHCLEVIYMILICVIGDQ